MVDRLLLYIDLLGFSVLVHTEKDLLPNLFLALDKSVVHQHGAFKVIQFSDTLLVYNEPAVDSWDKSWCAMYLCEFAQEIQYRLLGHNVFLRGLITYGQFEDTGPTPSESYKHVRAFWGEALIKSHQRRCCMIQLRREWGRFSNFSFRTPQRRISAYPARPSG